MANDGLEQLMQRGNVISGADPPAVRLGEAEAVAAFAQWLVYLRADGSLPFDDLARRFIASQGWEIEDSRFMLQLRPLPANVSGRMEPGGVVNVNLAEEQPGEYAPPEPEPEPADAPIHVTQGMRSPAGGTIVSGDRSQQP